jgi:lanosterol synthase
MDDGGWGETYMVSSVLLIVHMTSTLMACITSQSCVSGEYTQHSQSQVVQTSWVILALIYAQFPNKTVIRKGVELIMKRQQKVSE